MDITAANWSEDDNANTAAAPDGAPEGMAPSGVNNVLRAHQGALKRFYSWTIPKNTGGSATAFTLSYAVAPGALVNGMTHLVQFHAVNGTAATLNVNSLGATPLHYHAAGGGQTNAASVSGSISGGTAGSLSVNGITDVDSASSATQSGGPLAVSAHTHTHTVSGGTSGS